MTRESASPLRRLLLAATVLGVCAAVQTPLATGKVHVDPNGPAGQQYALPLDSARGEAAGDETAGTPGSSSKAPLFGQGIKPASGKRAANPGPGGSDGGKEADQIGAGNAAAASEPGKTSDDGNGSSNLWIAALVAAVLLVGVGGGLAARRRIAAEPQS
jgi:hypothetical protein